MPFNFMVLKLLSCAEILKRKTLKLLKDQREFLGEQMTRCDAYDMQLSALATSTTIMYCPEGISELTLDEKLDIFRSFYRVLFEEYTKRGASEASIYYFKIFEDLEEDFVHALGYERLYYFRDLRLDLLPAEMQEDIREIYEELEANGEENPLMNEDIQLLLRLNYLVKFFEPEFIMKRSFQIAQERGEMGCN